MEAVTVTASARVPEKESRDLAERTRKLTKEGLSFALQAIDTSLPHRLIVEAEQRLRIVLAQKTQEEAARMSEALGRDYRVHMIDLDSTLDNSSNTVRSNDVRAGFVHPAPARARVPGHAAADDVLGSAKKITPYANVVLAVVVPT